MESAELPDLDEPQRGKINGKGDWARWTTADEREFIRLLARGEQLAPNRVWVSPRVKLRGYLASLDLRSEWGEIERQSCEAYAQAWLARLEEETSK